MVRAYFGLATALLRPPVPKAAVTVRIGKRAEMLPAVYLHTGFEFSSRGPIGGRP